MIWKASSKKLQYEVNRGQEYSSIADAISDKTQVPFIPQKQKSVSGGCINQTSRIQSADGRDYFIKENDLHFAPFFHAEAQALVEIKKTQTIRVPEVITYGQTPSSSFLVLEFIKEGSSSDSGSAQLGHNLAKLHMIEQSSFGWTVDNCIGATPQPNPERENWVEFYRAFRLEHQFNLAKKKNKRFDKVDELLDGISFFFQDYSPHPSLLHGDLWGGNASFDSSGKPFIFDPASYYGDREADIAFTYMFGGFSPAFYKAYHDVYPLAPGFSMRKSLYNLYHELNHFNLFGGGYANSAQSSIDELVAHFS